MAHRSTSANAQPRVGIIGWSMTRIGEHPGRSYLDLLLEALQGAVAGAGLGFAEIDGLYVCPDDFGAPATPMLATRLPELLGTSVRTLAMVDCGGMTGALAVKSALQDIRAGLAGVAVVAAGSKTARSGLTGEPEVYLDRILHTQTSLLGPWIFPYVSGGPVPLYAMATQRYMKEYGLAPETIATAAVTLRRNARDNELAQFREPITVSDVLASKIVSPPIHLLECCSMSEGGGAVVLASESAVERLGKEAVWITGMGEWHEPTHFTPARGRVDRFPAIARSAAAAFASAGLEPKDVDVAELYGAFAATELITYEEMGFFPAGTAGAAVEEGRTAAGGRPVINPSGGRLSLGHVPTVTPILETVEIASQLAGRAGPRQVKGARVGVVQAEHGMDNGSMVLVLEA